MLLSHCFLLQCFKQLKWKNKREMNVLKSNNLSGACDYGGVNFINKEAQ